MVQRFGARTRSNGQWIAQLDAMAEAVLPDYNFERYRHYPAASRERWVAYARARLRTLMNDPEWTVYSAGSSGAPAVLGCRVSGWDRAHYGFGLGFIHVLLRGPGRVTEAAQGEALDACVADLRSRDVRFACARVSGSDLAALHTFEERGFRYYETEISPVAGLAGRHLAPDSDVRLMRAEELEVVKQIAARAQFPLGHYQLDPGFDQGLVATMYAKWVETSWNSGEPIAVIAPEGSPLGYFIFRPDPDLSKALGRQYGTMRSLALDPSARGRGLGRRLFKGCMALLADQGIEFVDSAFSTKNHASAALHADEGFHSVYEEVTMHRWLGSGQESAT